MKRRSFLTILGLAPVAPLAAAKVVEDTTPTVNETMGSYALDAYTDETPNTAVGYISYMESLKE
jgi:hypothetical protein